MSASLPDRIAESTAYLRTRCVIVPHVGIVLGTGLAALAKRMEIVTTVSYAEIPHFPLSTVESHSGRLLFGYLEGKAVVAMQGRFHHYEGFTLEQVTFPIRVMKALGASVLAVSNSSGGIAERLVAGSVMLIEDHINLLGISPLTGRNHPELGPRWPDMTEPYDLELIRLAEETAATEGLKLQRGVFACLPGPQLETRAEYRMLRTIGADAVGLSTVPEVIVAVHSGMRTLGLSIITDECVPERLRKTDESEMIATLERSEPDLVSILCGVIKRL